MNIDINSSCPLYLHIETNRSMFLGDEEAQEMIYKKASRYYEMIKKWPELESGHSKHNRIHNEKYCQERRYQISD